MAVWALPLLLAGMLGLAACGVASSPGATTTPTPTAAQILQSASNVSIKDMAFTFTLTMTASGQTTNASGSAELTKTPSRVEMSISVPVSGTPISFMFIADAATNISYAKFGPNSLGLPTTVWYKISIGSALGSLTSLGNLASSYANYSSLTNTTLVGSDTINGVAVWHIHGTDTSGATPTAGTTPTGSTTVDVYFRKDNYYPVQATITGGGLNMTITFTGINTGLTIALPPASEVKPLP